MKRPRISIILLDLLAGIIFIIFNFDEFLRNVAQNWSQNPTLTNLVLQISQWPDALFLALSPTKTELFTDIMTLCAYGLWAYLGAIAMLALIRLNIRIAANGALGLTLGLSSIALLSWFGVLLVILSGILLAILGFIGTIWAFVRRFVLIIWEFLAPILSFILPIVLALAIGALVLLAIVALVQKLRFKGIAGLFIFGGALYFAWPLLIENILLPLLRLLLAISAFLREFLAPIVRLIGLLLGFIWGILGFIFGLLVTIVSWLANAALVVGVVLAILGAIITAVGSAGALLLDQFKAAWHGGTGQRGVLLGSFSIGVAFAMIMLTSSGSLEVSQAIDQVWHETAFIAKDFSPRDSFDAILPEIVRETSYALFRGANAPYFDALVLAILFPVSYLGVLRGLSAQHDDEFNATFVRQDVLMVGGLLMLVLPAIALAMLAAASSNES